MENEPDVPWDIRLIAAFFIYCGSLGLIETICLPFLSSAEFSLGFLLIPLGFGLCKRHASAEWWTKFIGCLFLIAGGVFCVFGSSTILHPDGSHQPIPLTIGSNVIPIASWPYLILGPLTLFFGLWMIRSVNRFYSLLYTKSIVEVKEQEEEEAEDDMVDASSVRITSAYEELSARTTMYLGSGALLAVVVSALQISLLFAVPGGTDQTYTRTSDVEDAYKTTVEEKVFYGERFGELAYVVFYRRRRDQNTVNAPAEIVGRDALDKLMYLRVPDGEERPLPGEHLVYEVRDGRVQRYDLQLTTDQLEAYLDSNPERYGAESLNRFLHRNDDARKGLR